MFLKKIEDMVKKSRNSNIILFTNFLNILEISEIKSKNFKDINLEFYGGLDTSERKILKISPIIEPYYINYPISILKIKTKPIHSHRDYLGSILNLGISRELIGDIVFDVNDNVYVYVVEYISEYIQHNLLKVKNTPVSIEEYNGIIIPKTNLNYKFILSSSLRIDSIISKFINKNREYTSDLINQNMIFLNGQLIKKQTKLINTGDLITIRKKGRLKILKIEEITTKKNKFKIEGELTF